MKISVVIPVFNEEKYLHACLSSILNGNRKPDELMVVDGGSTDKSVEIAKSLGVTVLRNPDKTAAAGRNVGIKAATGEIIAFTDGDCEADPGWLEAIENAFNKHDVDAVGGKILPAKAINEIEEYWMNLQLNVVMQFGDEPFFVRERNFRNSFITANCAYRRKFLIKMHGFSRWFANNGEDVDLQWRSLKAGGKLFYSPDAIIYFHGVTTIKDLRRKSFRNGVSSSKLQKKYGGKINYDLTIYAVWAKSFKGTVKREKWARYNLEETTWHLLGKYYGSLKAHVINV